MRIGYDPIPLAAPAPVVIDSAEPIYAKAKIGVGEMLHEIQEFVADFYTIGAHGQEEICFALIYTATHEFSYLGHDSGFTTLEIYLGGSIKLINIDAIY
jgi:hypothetical protein